MINWSRDFSNDTNGLSIIVYRLVSPAQWLLHPSQRSCYRERSIEHRGLMASLMAYTRIGFSESK